MSPRAMLQSLHDDCGLGYPEIAEKLGVSRTAVWNWSSRGRAPRAVMAMKIRELYSAQGKVGAPPQGSFQDVISDAKSMIAEALEVPLDAVTITIQH